MSSGLGNFPEEPHNAITRIAGEPLRIICTRPVSFPEADIIWMKRLDQGFVPIDYNDRITIDPDGRSPSPRRMCQAHSLAELQTADIAHCYRWSELRVCGFIGQRVLQMFGK